MHDFVTSWNDDQDEIDVINDPDDPDDLDDHDDQDDPDDPFDQDDQDDQDDLYDLDDWMTVNPVHTKICRQLTVWYISKFSFMLFDLFGHYSL